MMFNESSDFDKMMEKRKKFYKRMETDFDFRMRQVDLKLISLNGFAGYDKYMRYKTTVIEHDFTGQEVNTYEIGIHGQIK